MPQETVIIPLSKSRILLSAVIAVAFIGAGLWILVYEPVFRFPVLNNPVGKYAFAFALIIYPLLAVVPLLTRIFGKESGIVLCPEGIYNNSDNNSVRFIDWEDVTSIRLFDNGMRKHICIELENPRDYINREKNFFRRSALAYNFRHYDSPAVITGSRFKAKTEAIFDILFLYWIDPEYEETDYDDDIDPANTAPPLA